MKVKRCKTTKTYKNKICCEIAAYLILIIFIHRREPPEREELLLRELPELLELLRELLRELDTELLLFDELLRELDTELLLFDELLRELDTELLLFDELLRELEEVELLREVPVELPLRRVVVPPTLLLLPREALFDVLLTEEPVRRVVPVTLSERLLEEERLPEVPTLVLRDEPVRELTLEVTAVRRFSSESTLTIRRFSSREGTLT